MKDVSVDIPHNKLVVITGVSGSGKSSLAFDTLYAEGQRRYVESLSSYARQFLGRMQKPEVEHIDGIPPAIAIQQKVTNRNPRSTVGTVTEIYDYLKLLFARVGHTYSPISNVEVRTHTVKDVVDTMMAQPVGSKVYLLAPIPTTKSAIEKQLKIWNSEGFSRLWHNGDILRISDAAGERASGLNDKTYLLVDRIVTDGEPSTANRFADSVQTAFFEGKGACALHITTSDGEEKHLVYSERFEADGLQFIEPSEHLFDFNNPLGACPTCNGFGIISGVDLDLVIPDKSLSVYDGAIVCWLGDKMGKWKDELVMNARYFDFPIHTPYYELTAEQKRLLWTGNEYFRGLNAFFDELEHSNGIPSKIMLARFRGKTICPDCQGLRLRKEASYVKINGCSISDLCQMPISKLKLWFDGLELPESEALAAKQLLTEIRSRLLFMEEVGLNYLTLNRLSNSLSGGEGQRINLAKSLGSSLVGSLYVLDEPSIGLHARDTEKLIRVLRALRDLGNTIVVVEHDEDIIRAADYIIEIGPAAGRHGGEICYAGTPKLQPFEYHIPPFRRPWHNYIEVIGACENNLKNLNVKFPLNVMTVITGVSGSGKSSLVSQVLYPAVKKYYGGIAERTGRYSKLQGSMHLVKNIEFVDQQPLSRSSRSNPVTYLKAYDEIRKLYAEQQLAKQMGFTPSHFSFNTPGGRCEECQGEGTITIEMQFLADITLECEHCHGKRFKQDVLDVHYRDKSIHDILTMTVNQAIEFFSEDPECEKIVRRLKPLQDVGIGYVQLGQSSSTLSGGESQRVKLASFLAQENANPTIFVFDEPTTGLHHTDIDKLLSALNALIAKGHTVIVIEHNPAVIIAADHVIDLGPEGGDEGGNIVFEGTPEALMKCEKSYTGKFLKASIKK